MKGPDQRDTKGNQARGLFELIDGVLNPALRRRGFARADLLTRWPEIAGPDLATCSRPERIVWPRRRKATGETVNDPAPATLTIRVDGPASVMFQHMAPLILERINVYFGYRAVGKLRFVQAPIENVRTSGVMAPLCSPADASAVDAQIEPVQSAPLKDALGRLGRNIAASRRPFNKA